MLNAASVMYATTDIVAPMRKRSRNIYSQIFIKNKMRKSLVLSEFVLNTIFPNYTQFSLG